MAESKYLKNFKLIWSRNCHSMWGELFCVATAEQCILSDYANIPDNYNITKRIYAPNLPKRLGNFSKDAFLERTSTYRQTIACNRIVYFCAAFEAYFFDFLDAYLKNRTKYFDSAANTFTSEGHKIYGDTRKERKMVNRITTFSALINRSINSITPHLDHVNDLFVIRNVMAHQAGIVDSSAQAQLKVFKYAVNDLVNLSSDDIVELASHAINVAESLDSRISPPR